MTRRSGWRARSVMMSSQRPSHRRSQRGSRERLSKGRTAVVGRVPSASAAAAQARLSGCQCHRLTRRAMFRSGCGPRAEKRPCQAGPGRGGGAPRP